MSDSKFKSPISKWFIKVEKTEKALMALRDSVIKFENPTEPIGVEDWEALKGK